MENIIEIKNICGKKSAASIKHFYRETSYYLTWILIRLHLTANQVSALGLLFGLFASTLFISNNNILFIAASLFLFLSELVDYSDGEVARYRKYKGLPDELLRIHGGFFDSLNHIAMPLFLLCISISFIYISPYVIIIGFMSAMLNIYDAGLYGWLNSFLKLFKQPTVKEKKLYGILLNIRAKTYNTHVIPFMLLIAIGIDIIFNTNILFYLWLYYAFIGLVFFCFKLIRRCNK